MDVGHEELRLRLHDEEDHASVSAFIDEAAEMLQMPASPLGGGIGKEGGSVLYQGAGFHFQEQDAVGHPNLEIESARAVGCFPFNLQGSGEEAG